MGESREDLDRYRMHTSFRRRASCSTATLIKDAVPMMKHTISSQGVFDISKTCFTAAVIVEVTSAVVGVL
jgi:hypothetical protein